MKGDSLNKSTEKKDDERKTSDKKIHRKEVNEELSTEKPIDTEKNIKKELKGIEIEEYPNYLNKLLKQTDWIKQKDFIEILKNEEIPLTPKKFESFIRDKSAIWNEIRNNDVGNQEKLVIKFLSDKWNEISIPKSKSEMKKYETRLYFIKNDEKLINDEHNQLRKKVEDISNELNQLENNLEFFSESSNSNPLLVEVNNKIKELNVKKTLVESKLKQLKFILNQNLKDDI